MAAGVKLRAAETDIDATMRVRLTFCTPCPVLLVSPSDALLPLDMSTTPQKPPVVGRQLSMPVQQHLAIPPNNTALLQTTQAGARSQGSSPATSPQVSPAIQQSGGGGAASSATSSSSSAPGKSLRKVGKYKLGKTLGQGTFGKSAPSALAHSTVPYWRSGG